MTEHDLYYILARETPVDDRTSVLKEGDTFAIFDRYGNVPTRGLREHGIYHEDTRFLSYLRLNLFGKRPLLLSSTITEDNSLFTIDLTNPDITLANGTFVPRGTLYLHRAKFLWEGVCYEQIRTINYGADPVELALSLLFAFDFADMFQIRGTRRRHLGEFLEPEVTGQSVVQSYRGLDNVLRHARLEFSIPPAQLTSSEAEILAHLEPKEERVFNLDLSCEIGAQKTYRFFFENALGEVQRALTTGREQDCTVRTSDELCNHWIDRSTADLHTMITETPHGRYPYAGIPWFNTAFGRDGIITALETLWLNPTVARGVLGYLAATQAQATIPEQEAQPGKILHETRKGEMAAVGEVPFQRYYGSVDATPLFVVLAGAYYQRTGDLEFIRAIWPNVELAVRWIDKYGDVDGDGFVEYVSRPGSGLHHHGWKDSQDAVFHADGKSAQGPIALCEVQGYVYEAKLLGANLAALMGQHKWATELRAQAGELRARFEEAFWCEEIRTYAMALDGKKRRCQVRSSNPGHCLALGIASPEHAQVVAETLMEEQSFSGWGIRTLATSETRFNPMSYHNGSVWPHDNALIAYGFARYGIKEPVGQLFSGMLDASLFLELNRLPELFCGFPRHSGKGPTLYPTACSPQTWASSAVFLLLQACLGLSIDAPNREVVFSYPLLPESLAPLSLSNLQVGDAVVDLSLHRYQQDVGVNVVRREGQVTVKVIK